MIELQRLIQLCEHGSQYFLLHLKHPSYLSARQKPIGCYFQQDKLHSYVVNIHDISIPGIANDNHCN